MESVDGMLRVYVPGEDGAPSSAGRDQDTGGRCIHKYHDGYETDFDDNKLRVDNGDCIHKSVFATVVGMMCALLIVAVTAIACLMHSRSPCAKQKLMSIRGYGTHARIGQPQPACRFDMHSSSSGSVSGYSRQSPKTATSSHWSSSNL
jgi:hypothetical protein